MAIRKLILDDFFENHSFTLIGIHCTIEDYRLGYLLNKSLNLHLKRQTKDLENNKNTIYSIFEWEDKFLYNTWNLVANNCKIEKEIESINTLFNLPQNEIKMHPLIPEYKKANYLLKISDELPNGKAQIILKKILEIPQIITAYTIETNTLKSKDNLIFN